MLCREYISINIQKQKVNQITSHFSVFSALSDPLLTFSMECAQATLRFRRRRLLREEKYENAHKWKLGHSLSLNWLQIQFFPSFYLTLLFAGMPPPPSATCSTLKRPDYTICALILRYTLCVRQPLQYFYFLALLRIAVLLNLKKKRKTFSLGEGQTSTRKTNTKRTSIPLIQIQSF